MFLELPKKPRGTKQGLPEAYPELTEHDIRACLAYAADRERRLRVFG
jgi:uncharacterized protein (DUF433 family)